MWQRGNKLVNSVVDLYFGFRVTSMVHILDLYIFLFFKAQFISGHVFCRVVVSYDRKTAKWSCCCCQMKISCVHKAVFKWYLYQEERHLLEDPTTETQQDYKTGEETDKDTESIGVEKPCGLYPPTGSGLKDAVEYQMQIRVPAADKCTFGTKGQATTRISVFP